MVTKRTLQQKRADLQELRLENKRLSALSKRKEMQVSSFVRAQGSQRRKVKSQLAASRFQRQLPRLQNIERRKQFYEGTRTGRALGGLGSVRRSVSGSLKQSLLNVRRGQNLYMARKRQLAGLKQFAPIKPRNINFEGQRYRVQPAPRTAREEMDEALRQARSDHSAGTRFVRRLG